MTTLPTQINDAAHLASLMKEFTGSASVPWQISRMFSENTASRNGNWFRKDTEYTRYERKQALIFKREEDYNQGIRLVWLMAVQPRGKNVTTAGVKLLAGLLAPQGVHSRSYKGYRFEVPTLSERTIISLFAEGIACYELEDQGTNGTGPGALVPYVYLK